MSNHIKLPECIEKAPPLWLSVSKWRFDEPYGYDEWLFPRTIFTQKCINNAVFIGKASFHVMDTICHASSPSHTYSGHCF